MNKLRKMIPRYFRALRNKETPLMAKILAVFSLAYIFLPADVIPDIFPFVGYIDDAVLTASLLYFSNKMIPEEVIEEVKKIEN
ncbi:YkvA family protein [Anaerococcus murdochii]|uniref:DUF1232 domain-containing protein n=1 Tax=Anaerococcus murdochii TaxID=411577 RepID=A0ABS7SY09_9FIRM|nr:DUF1232 domain-containing protein [Anaerococcus murdochii]MBZ2386433.1 DUF1232 domain-containing protein [Anaerococcus murdochii]